RVRGPQTADNWPLPVGRALTIGLHSQTSEAIDVDLSPDTKIRSLHGIMSFDGRVWHLEEAPARRQYRLYPWVEFALGDTVLMVVPPAWRRWKGSEFVVDLEANSVVNFSLAHCGMPVVRNLVFRNIGSHSSPPRRLEIALPGYAWANEIIVP